MHASVMRHRQISVLEHFVRSLRVLLSCLRPEESSVEGWVERWTEECGVGLAESAYAGETSSKPRGTLVQAGETKNGSYRSV